MSPRLEIIAGMIPNGMRVADIGTDHALLPISLVKRGVSPKVIATDLNEKPYQTALRQVQTANSQSQVEVRKGYGLEVLTPKEVDVIIIAGMGGNTIRTILEGNPETLVHIDKLVLQPMTDAYSLRVWLNQHGWIPVREELIKEDEKIYLIIVAEKGEKIYHDEFLMEIGPKLIEQCSPLLVEYLEKISEDYKRILSGLSKSRSVESMKKAAKITNKLNKIREVINQCRQITG